MWILRCIRVQLKICRERKREREGERERERERESRQTGRDRQSIERKRSRTGKRAGNVDPIGFQLEDDARVELSIF